MSRKQPMIKNTRLPTPEGGLVGQIIRLYYVIWDEVDPSQMMSRLLRLVVFYSIIRERKYSVTPLKYVLKKMA